MEDTKLVRVSGPPQTTGPGRSLDSGAVSVVVGKEAVGERMQLDTSRVLPEQPCVAASSVIAKQRFLEGSSQHNEDSATAIAGVMVVGVHEQTGRPSGNRELFSESEASNNGQLPSNVVSSGISVPNCSVQPPRNSENFDCPEKKRKQDLDSWAVGGLGNGKLKGANSGADGSPKGQKQADGNELASTEDVSLMSILEKLIRLDPSEIFKEPVDDSFAPNYSKLIKTPMCFSMMREKIGMGQYPTWSSFLEDFERICYNAMKYNQKRSKIWNAASVLLREGKKIMEPYSRHEDIIFGSRKVVEGEIDPAIRNATENVAHLKRSGTAGELGEGESGASHQGSVLEREFVPGSNVDSAVKPVVLVPPQGDVLASECGGRDPTLPSDIYKGGLKQNVTVIPDLQGSLMRNHDNSQVTDGFADGVLKQRSVNLMNEDVKVEILESTDSEDVRPDSGDDATECSSSFGGSENTGESDEEVDGLRQNAEIESALRDGNGALAAPFGDDDEIGGGNERKKKSMNADWKKYRRGIEWRCRWLLIRMKELRERSEKYNRLLDARNARKAWLADVQPGEESSARTTQMVDSPHRGKIMRRLRRQHREEIPDLDVYLAAHPVFSRYGKRKRHDTEDKYGKAKLEAMQSLGNEKNAETDTRVPEESDTEEQMDVTQSDGQLSQQHILLLIDKLQGRLEKAKSLLIMGAPPKLVTQVLTTPKFPSNLPRISSLASPRISAPGVVPRPPGTKGRPPSGQSPGVSVTPSANGAPHKQGSASFRRKSSDYDINNMVMPTSVGVKYVEQVKHADIWTPNWRLVDGPEVAHQSTGGSSSDEDTDDERFEERHRGMEAVEKKQRYLLPIKRSPDGESTDLAKGRSKSGFGKGSVKISSRSSFPAKVSAAVTIDAPDSSVYPTLSPSVPKGKRRKRLFSATRFTSDHAQRFAAYLGEPLSNSQSPEAAEESMPTMDPIEIRPQEISVEPILLAQVEKASAQLLSPVDQVEVKRKRNAISGLQVLANP